MSEPHEALLKTFESAALVSQASVLAGLEELERRGLPINRKTFNEVAVPAMWKAFSQSSSHD